MSTASFLLFFAPAKTNERMKLRNIYFTLIFSTLTIVTFGQATDVNKISAITGDTLKELLPPTHPGRPADSLASTSLRSAFPTGHRVAIIPSPSPPMPTFSQTTRRTVPNGTITCSLPMLC